MNQAEESTSACLRLCPGFSAFFVPAPANSPCSPIAHPIREPMVLDRYPDSDNEISLTLSVNWDTPVNRRRDIREFVPARGRDFQSFPLTGRRIGHCETMGLELSGYDERRDLSWTRPSEPLILMRMLTARARKMFQVFHAGASGELPQNDGSCLRIWTAISTSSPNPQS